MAWRGSWMVVAAVLALPTAAAQAGVRNAETVLPPGQSGFVPPEGTNPHLTDQIPLFESFTFKPATFDQPGTVESPRAGVTITRDAFGVPNIRGTTAGDAWFGAGYAVAQDRLVELELFRRSTTATSPRCSARAGLSRTSSPAATTTPGPSCASSSSASRPRCARGSTRTPRASTRGWPGSTPTRR